MKKSFLAILMLSTGLALGACQDDDLGDRMEEVGEDIEDAAEEAADEVEDAAEELDDGK